MSQPSYDPEVVAIFQQQFVETYILNALTALVAYEYMITLQQEISTMWTRKFSGATLSFMLNRYLQVWSVVMVYVPFTAASCVSISRLTEAIGIAQFLVFAAFSAMRIYALWDCNIPLALIVVILNLAPVVTNIYDFSIATPAYSLDPIFGAFCSLPIPSTRLFSLTLPLITRVALVAADFLVLVLTWMKTFTARRDAAKMNVKVPVLTLFFRDGTLYFVALLAMNLAHILLQSVNVFEQLTPATLFFSTLTPILISRFLLNLRELRPSENGGESLGNFSQFSVSGFRVPSNIFVGNIGGNLADDTGDENTTTDDSGEGRASSGSEGGSNDSSDVIPTEESGEEEHVNHVV